MTDCFTLLTFMLRYFMCRWSFFILFLIWKNTNSLNLKLDIIHVNLTIWFILFLWILLTRIKLVDFVSIGPILSIVFNFLVRNLLFTLHTCSWMIKLWRVLLLLLLVFVVQILQKVFSCLLLFWVLSWTGCWSNLVYNLIW